MAKTKLKAKTAEQALTVVEHELAEERVSAKGARHLYAAELSRLKTEEQMRQRQYSKELAAHQRDLLGLQQWVDALLWSLASAHEQCRLKEKALREKPDSLALAG